MKQMPLKVCAIIPARGGSKGIPQKNIQLLADKPLITYSIEHSLSSKYIERTIVSTDDEEIAKVAMDWGAEVPFLRPAELAEDHVLDWPVFVHALEWLKAKERYIPDIVVHLRPTSPLRLPRHIDNAVELLINNPEADSVRSVSLPSQHPYRMFSIGEKGYLRPLLETGFKEPYVLRRQDLPSVYWYNCVVDVTRHKTIMEKKSMTGDRILPQIIEPFFAIDIDAPEDLSYAEIKMRQFKKLGDSVV